jgi:hypothetical protein
MATRNSHSPHAQLHRPWQKLTENRCKLESGGVLVPENSEVLKRVKGFTAAPNEQAWACLDADASLTDHGCSALVADRRVCRLSWTSSRARPAA